MKTKYLLSLSISLSSLVNKATDFINVFLEYKEDIYITYIQRAPKYRDNKFNIVINYRNK